MSDVLVIRTAEADLSAVAKTNSDGIKIFYVSPRISGNVKPWSLGQVMTTCVGNYIYKFGIAIILTPVIYLVHGWIERYLGKSLASEMKQAAMRRN